MTAKITLRTGHSKEESDMKKKLLLIALPALMVLSGCGNVQKEQPKVESEQPAIQFEEDTVAHEEIFGEAVEAKQPAIRKMGELDDEPAYKIGYQLHYDEGTDKLSIRFIAAIKTTYTSKVWSRGISTVAGVETKAFGNTRSDATPLASTVYYTSLSNGGSDIMRAGQGDYAAYSSFIVYSMTGIPYTANKDSYVGVSLLMDEVQTDFYAVKIETNAGHTASTDTFTLSSDKQNYFLKGTIGGNADTYVVSDGSKVGDNRARFTLNLSASDSFVIINRGASGSKFQYWSSACLTYDGNSDVLTDFQNNAGEIQTKNAGKYALFLNNSETARLYRHKYTQTADYYVVGPAGPNIGDDGWTFPAESSPYRFFVCPSEDNNRGELLNIHLNEGNFKVASTDWSGDEWAYWGFKHKGWGGYDQHGDSSTVTGGGASNFSGNGEGRGANIHCDHAGYYNLYLTNDDWLSIEVVSLD